MCACGACVYVCVCVFIFYVFVCVRCIWVNFVCVCVCVFVGTYVQSDMRGQYNASLKRNREQTDWEGARGRVDAEWNNGVRKTEPR